jgi:hypothetical protein
MAWFTPIVFIPAESGVIGVLPAALLLQEAVRESSFPLNQGSLGSKLAEQDSQLHGVFIPAESGVIGVCPSGQLSQEIRLKSASHQHLR